MNPRPLNPFVQSKEPGTPNTGTLTGRRTQQSSLTVRILRTLLFAFAALHLSFVLLTSCILLAYRFVNPPVSTLMLYRATFDHVKNRKLEFIPLKKMPSNAGRMFVSLEDSNFWTHPGIDWEATKRAYGINRRAGYLVVGGSTITQQLSRTLFLTLDRNYVRKYLEAIIALEMDFIMPKERILELYLNYIEWGKGVYGIGAASRYHYGKNVYKLTKDELIRLAVIITSPVRFNVNTWTKNAGMRERYAYLDRKYGNRPQPVETANGSGASSDAASGGLPGDLLTGALPVESVPVDANPAGDSGAVVSTETAPADQEPAQENAAAADEPPAQDVSGDRQDNGEGTDTGADPENPETSDLSTLE